MNTEDILMKINTAKTNHEVAELYDKWSKTYDHDLKIIRPGNKGAFKTVEWFVKYVHIFCYLFRTGFTVFESKERTYRRRSKISDVVIFS